MKKRIITVFTSAMKRWRVMPRLKPQHTGGHRQNGESCSRSVWLLLE